MTTHPVLYEKSFGVVDQDIEWDDPLIIGDDVWVGHNVVILPGCKSIGRGAVIGAGAIVTKDVEPYAIMAGNPARKLRERFAPELIEQLEASRWWEMDQQELRKLVAEQPDLVHRPQPAQLARWISERRK